MTPMPCPAGHCPVGLVLLTLLSGAPGDTWAALPPPHLPATPPGASHMLTQLTAPDGHAPSLRQGLAGSSPRCPRRWAGSLQGGTRVGFAHLSAFSARPSPSTHPHPYDHGRSPRPALSRSTPACFPGGASLTRSLRGPEEPLTSSCGGHGHEPGRVLLGPFLVEGLRPCMPEAHEASPQPGITGPVVGGRLPWGAGSAGSGPASSKVCGPVGTLTPEVPAGQPRDPC